MRIAPESNTCDFKIVYVGSNLALSSTQLDELAKIAGPEKAVVDPMPPMDDGERTRMVRLMWPFELSRTAGKLTPCLFLFQAPTNVLYARTRAAVLQGADFIVLTADASLASAEDNTRWMDELKSYRILENTYYGAREAGPPLVIQYVCPASAKTDPATLKKQLNPRSEFAELVFDGSDPASMATKTLELVIERLRRFA